MNRRTEYLAMVRDAARAVADERRRHAGTQGYRGHEERTLEGALRAATAAGFGPDARAAVRAILRTAPVVALSPGVKWQRDAQRAKRRASGKAMYPAVRFNPRKRNPLVYTVNGIADHGVKWTRHGDRATATIHGAIGSVKLELNPVNVLDGSGPRKPGGVAWGTAPAYELLINDRAMARLKASTLDAALADVNEVLADELGGMYATMLAAHPLNRKNPAKRRNPAGWTFTIAPSPGQRVRAKRIVSLWNGTMVGNVATFETATESRLAASQMDDDGIKWTRSNPRRRNPTTPRAALLKLALSYVPSTDPFWSVRKPSVDAIRRALAKHGGPRRNPVTTGDDVTKPYPFAKKEAEYDRQYGNGPSADDLRAYRDQAMRDRDEWSRTSSASQSAEARTLTTLKAAQKAHDAAEKQARHDYAVAGWHADDTITIAQERKRRKERAESRKGDVSDEIAALSNPRRRRNPAPPPGYMTLEQYAASTGYKRDLMDLHYHLDNYGSDLLYFCNGQWVPLRVAGAKGTGEALYAREGGHVAVRPRTNPRRATARRSR
jgi:hypothetical protein